MKDSELIQKVHSGNKEAVGIIIERYYVDIYRFCLYMVQTEDDAYDIAQETFLKFMKYGTSYKHHNLKGYLLTIARNICFNYFRDKKEKVTAIEWEEIDQIPNNKDMLTEAEDAVYLRNLLKELSQDTREVIILRIYEEMKFKDIHFEGLCIDKFKRIVVRDGNEIELTYTEFEMLLLLAQNA